MPQVIAEELITRFTNPQNGSGPLWCYGSPTIVRDGEKVFASVYESSAEHAPLCNTYWRLFCREGDEWQRTNANPKVDEREPCPLVRLPGGRVVMSTNPAESYRGGERGVRESWNCVPQLLEFSAADPSQPPRQMLPQWDREYLFTEHSYRGIGADYESGEILLLNVSYYEGQAWSFRDAAGNWPAQGFIGFPLRGAYPQIALNGRAGAVMAISDVVEPNLAWREFKRKVTCQNWDYDFRQLYFTFTPDITQSDFSPILTVASRDETAGRITNLDLWLGPDGDAHLLYQDVNVWHPFMRDEFFPNLPLTVSLNYARIHKGQVAERRTLVECIEDRCGSIQDPAAEFAASNPRPDYAAFHSTDGNDLHVFFHQTGPTGTDDPDTGNYLMQLLPEQTAPEKLDLENPLKRFLTASVRTGTPPSETLDVLGLGKELDEIHYIQIKMS